MLKCPKCEAVFSEYRQRVLAEKYAIDVVEDDNGDIVEKRGVELNPVNSIEISCASCGFAGQKSSFGSVYRCRICGSDTDFRCNEGLCICLGCWRDARANLCPRTCDCGRQVAHHMSEPIPDLPVRLRSTARIRDDAGASPSAWVSTILGVPDVPNDPLDMGRPYYISNHYGVGESWRVRSEEADTLLEHNYWNLEISDDPVLEDEEEYYTVTLRG